MPTLKIGTRTFEASNGRVVREADRMFKLSPERRAHRLEKAKTALARDAAANGANRHETSGSNHPEPAHQRDLTTACRCCPIKLLLGEMRKSAHCTFNIARCIGRNADCRSCILPAGAEMARGG